MKIDSFVTCTFVSFYASVSSSVELRFHRLLLSFLCVRFDFILYQCLEEDTGLGLSQKCCGKIWKSFRFDLRRNPSQLLHSGIFVVENCSKLYPLR